jgi:methionyl aminopeptidase
MTTYVTASAQARASRDGTIKLHGPDGFSGMRAAGKLAAEVLDALIPHVVPGVTTGELDDMVRAHMLREGAVPATLGYRGFTHSCCTRSTMSSVMAFPATRSCAMAISSIST